MILMLSEKARSIPYWGLAVIVRRILRDNIEGFVGNANLTNLEKNAAAHYKLDCDNKWDLYIRPSGLMHVVYFYNNTDEKEKVVEPIIECALGFREETE